MDFPIHKLFFSYQMSYGLSNPEGKLNVVFNLHNCANLHENLNKMEIYVLLMKVGVWTWRLDCLKND